MKYIKEIGVIAVIVLYGLIYYYTPKDTPGTQTACTMEALLCPDGSGVGREGLQCVFKSCPNTGPYTGKLEQSTDGFRLIMDSRQATGEVSYVMPLQIKKVSNALAQSVNREVTVYGSFSVGNTLEVDRLEELPLEKSDPTVAEVGVGQTLYINGVRITLNKIVADSRCPIDVQCIQAGSITANVTLKSDTDADTKDISSTAPTAFDSFIISIVDIKPAKVASHAPDPVSYALTFKVVAR